MHADRDNMRVGVFLGSSWGERLAMCRWEDVLDVRWLESEGSSEGVKQNKLNMYVNTDF